MTPRAKILASLLLSASTLTVLTGCAGQPSAENSPQPASNHDWANVQVDTLDASSSISDAFDNNQSLAQIRKQLPNYLEHRIISDEQAVLTAGSCGLHGRKDFTLTVSGGDYLSVYTSRTNKTALSETLGRQALVSKACGIYG